MVFSAGGARRTGPALESMYRFVLWLVPTVEKFPRRQKFLLGDRLQEPVNLSMRSSKLCGVESAGRVGSGDWLERYSA